MPVSGLKIHRPAMPVTMKESAYENKKHCARLYGQKVFDPGAMLDATGAHELQLSRRAQAGN
jgi:hypothetical protein